MTHKIYYDIKEQWEHDEILFQVCVGVGVWSL